MSGPRIMKDSVQGNVSYPGHRFPTDVKVRITVSGGVVTPIPTESTVGCSISTAGSGVFTLAFPAAKRIARMTGSVHPVTPGTVANHRLVGFNNPSTVTAGTLVFRTISMANPPAIAEPEAGSTIEVCVELDYGS